MEDKREYIARAFVSSAKGIWYVAPDPRGRFVIPKGFSSTDKKRGYKFILLDNKTIILTPDITSPVSSRLSIPKYIRDRLDLNDGKDVFRIEKINDEGFKLVLCRGGEII